MQRSLCASTKRRQRQAGQVASFFALSFALFMVFLLMIINAGLQNRDRIKIQNTADLASLVAANVQRYNLNTIGEINDAIDDAYIATQVILSNPFTASPCTMLSHICDTSADCTICANQDATYAAAIIAAYTAVQGTYAAQIGAIIAKGNEKAFEYGKLTALAAANLPADARRMIIKRHGGQFPAAEKMVEEYDKNGFDYDYDGDGQNESLKEIYSVVGSGSQPLFIPEPTTRLILSYRGVYNPCSNYLVTGGTDPCFTGNFNIPMPSFVGHQIEDTGDLTPSFFTSVSYSPQFVFNKFATRKMPEGQSPYTAGAVYQNSGGTQSLNLFDMIRGKVATSSGGEARQFMTAWSASRPYGGSPESGGYDGAKLIGLASKQSGEIEHDLGLALTLETNSGKHTFTEKDFLH